MQPLGLPDSTRCCIAGGGPAGIMLGFLLARAGVETLVLEKHVDFFRDFRGDTIHPSTLEVMAELGLLEQLLKLPHQEVTRLSGVIAGQTVPIADFSHVPTRCKFLALMPQWDFLNFLSEHAKSYSTFRLQMQAEAVGLLRQDTSVIGVKVRTPAGESEVRADLTVAADGRHSTLRTASGLSRLELGAPMDVLWMRLSRLPTDPHQVFGYTSNGKIFIMLDRDTYWQCGFVIPKGTFDEIRGKGLTAFRDTIRSLVPFIGDRPEELTDWSQIKLLTVQVDRLRPWFCDGLLCIGDAAHAMSPVGGVGINLAIQDAVAAANLLQGPLRSGRASLRDLARVQRRRTYPTVMTQALQLAIQRFAIRRVLSGETITRVPALLRLLKAMPALQRLPARVIGIGFRPEHIRSASYG